MSRSETITRIRVAAFTCTLVLLTSAIATAQQALTPGKVNIISPADLSCLTSETVVNPGNRMTIRKACTGPRVQLYIDSGTTLVPDTINVQANAKLSVQFRIDEPTTGVASGTWLPIHVAVPVSWTGRAFNDSVAPVDVVANLAVNSFVSLREGDPTDIAVNGRLISGVPFQGFTHGGPNACLSTSKDKISAALKGVKCLVGTVMKDEGTSHVDIAAVVQAGKTYNIEIELIGELFSLNTGTPITPSGQLIVGHPRINFEADGGEDLGLSVTGDILVTVGTSVAAELQGLQDQIDQLRHDLANHTHEYLTGRGVGQNNTVAITGGALLTNSSRR